MVLNMAPQGFDETTQLLYFPHIGNVILVILAFVVLILIGILAVILLRNQKLNNKSKSILLVSSFIFGGIILGGVPNVVLIIQHIFADILTPNPWFSLIMRVSIFLGLTIVFGRIFCGYVCPLGALQELTSMVRFKGKLDYERKYWRKKNFLRMGFFVAYAVFSIIFGLQATLYMNPINGFLIIWTPFDTLIFIALIFLLITVFVSFFIYRPYCRFFCPFGALANLFGRLSPLKIRKTAHCNECGVCAKICPTLEIFDSSSMGECYYCNRCIEFCANEMFIDVGKISEINRFLSTYTLNFKSISKEKFFDKTLKSLIRLIIPYKRTQVFEQLIKALKGEEEMTLEPIQNIVIRLNNIFPEEIDQLNKLKYKNWIEENAPRWKEKMDITSFDKIMYGMKKEAEKI